MSISRGPLRNDGRRPTERSTDCVRSSRARAEPRHVSPATTFQKKGWSAYPTGSVR